MAQRKAKKKSKKTTVRKTKSKSKAPAKKAKASKSDDLVELTIVSQSEFKPQKKFITDWVNRIAVELQGHSKFDERLENLKWSGAELTIAFLDTKQARALNKMYRGRDYATDVLSFIDDTDGVLGEIAICPDVVKKQAKEHDLSFDEELGYMILHGMLHLLGFDHEKSKREDKIMLSLQDSIFETLVASLP